MAVIETVCVIPYHRCNHDMGHACHKRMSWRSNQEAV